MLFSLVSHMPAFLRFLFSHSPWQSQLSFPLFSASLQAVGSDGVRVAMESALTARDRVGVQDFVLLENFTSEAAFIENLRKRFKENLIYVSNRGCAVACSPKARGIFQNALPFSV